MSEDPIHRARRWELFFNEDGGLKDMLDHIGMTYLERMSEVQPWEVEKLSKLSMAHKITKQVEGMVRAIIADGSVQRAARDYTDKIEKIPHAKRRFL